MEVDKACGLVAAKYCVLSTFKEVLPKFPIEHAKPCAAFTIGTFRTSFDPLRRKVAGNTLSFTSYLTFQTSKPRYSHGFLYFLL